MKTTLVNATKEMIFNLEKTSACTFEGAGGDLNVWMLGINEQLTQLGLPEVKVFYTWSGKLMNEIYHLTGTNAYQEDLTFFAFSIAQFNQKDMGKLAMWKLQIGARWLDDIVDNNKRREDELDEQEFNVLYH